MAKRIITPESFTVSFDKPLPATLATVRKQRKPSIYADTCKKILSGEVHNARLDCSDGKLAANVASGCSSHIRRHKLSLRVCKHGNQVFILRKKAPRAVAQV